MARFLLGLLLAITTQLVSPFITTPSVAFFSNTAPLQILKMTAFQATGQAPWGTCSQPLLRSSTTFTGACIGSRSSMSGRAVLRSNSPVGGTGVMRGAQSLRCLFGNFDASMDDDDDWDMEDDEDYEGERMVMLRDPVMDRVIECFVDREIEIDGKAYATLQPVDTPVILASYETINGTEQLMPILEDELIDILFDTASAVLAEMDLMLSRSAVVLTVEGGTMSSFDEEGSEDSDDEFGLFERTEDDDDTNNFHPGTVSLKVEELVDPSRPGGGGLDIFYDPDDDEDDSENEKVQVLATFYFDGKKHVVAAPLEPVLIIGSPSQPDSLADDANLQKVLGGVQGFEGGGETTEEEDDDFPDALEMEEFLLPDREELEKVTPIIEEQLETIFKSEVQEKRKLLNLRASLQKQWNTPSDEEV